MNIAIVDMVKSGIDAGSAMPLEYKIGVAAAGLLITLATAIWKWRHRGVKK